MSDRASLDEVSRLRHIIETQRLINSMALDSDELMRVICERAQMITGAGGAAVELAEGDEMVYRAVAGSAGGSCCRTSARLSTPTMSTSCKRWPASSPTR